jgi:hypothetical protein
VSTASHPAVAAVAKIGPWSVRAALRDAGNVKVFAGGPDLTGSDTFRMPATVVPREA